MNKKKYYYLNKNKFIPYEKERLQKLSKSYTNLDKYKKENNNMFYGMYINNTFKYFDNRKYLNTKEKRHKSKGLKCNNNWIWVDGAWYSPQICSV